MSENNPSQFIVAGGLSAMVSEVYIPKLAASCLRPSPASMQATQERGNEINPTTKDFLVVRQEGARQAKRSLKQYNPAPRSHAPAWERIRSLTNG